MNRRRPFIGATSLVTLVALIALACTSTSESGPIMPGADAQKQVLEALITAEPGAVIELGEGTFAFDTTLSLDVAGVTFKGQGLDKTVLDFANQAPGSGGEGLMVTADNFVMEDIAVKNSRGDAIKVEGTSGVTFRRVMVDWEGPPKTENGAYGLYPVQCKNILIEYSKVRGASDAGIYVGQSENIIVRHSEAWENVAGIEIENSTNADVHDNVAYGNTGGILVFSLPELPVKNGKGARVFNNKVYDNNLANFGKEGAIVSTIPAGSGVILMASDQTHIFENEFRDNKTSNIAIVSFQSTAREYNDPEYDPFSEGVWIHDNTITNGGYEPEGAMVEAAKPFIGDTMADIVWDGIVDSAALVDGELPPEKRLYIGDNGEATFVNLDFGTLLTGEKPQPQRDLMAHAGELPNPPAPVALPGT